MPTYNHVTLIGHLGKDPEIRHTESGSPVCNFSLATGEKYTRKDGEKVDRTDWHRVSIWGTPAENCAKYLRKGSLALVEGRIQYREWEDKEGNKRWSTEIAARSVQFMDPKPKGEQPPVGDDEVPF